VVDFYVYSNSKNYFLVRDSTEIDLGNYEFVTYRFRKIQILEMTELFMTNLCISDPKTLTWVSPDLA